MARKKRIAITFLSVIILLAGFFIWFFVLKKETAVVVPTIDTVADQRCYGTREFARGGVFNYNLVAIDLGSNSFHLIIAQESAGCLQVLFRQKKAVG